MLNIAATIVSLIVFLLLALKVKRILERVNESMKSPFTIKGRRVSSHEKFFAHTILEDQICTSFGFVVKITAEKDATQGQLITEALLRQALQRVQSRQPILRCRLVQDRSVGHLQYFLEQMEDVDTSALEVIHTKDKEAWRPEFERECHAAKAFQSYLFRMKVFLVEEEQRDEATIVLGISHVVFDMKAAYIFIRELMVAMDEIQKGIPASQTELTPLPLLPAFSDIADFKVTWRDMLSFVGYILNLNGPKVPYKHRVAPVSQRTMNTELLKLNEEQTKQMVLACKKNGTTVFAFVQAALIKILDEIYKKGDSYPKQYTVGCPVSDRKKYKISEETIGFFSMAHAIPFETSEASKDIFSIARSVKKSLQHAMETVDVARADPAARIIRELANPKQLVKVSNGPMQGRVQHVCHSSGGIYPYDTKCGSFKLAEMYPFLESKLGGALMWLGSTTVGKEFMFTFTSLNPMISSEEHKDLTTELLKALTTSE